MRTLASVVGAILVVGVLAGSAPGQFEVFPTSAGYPKAPSGASEVPSVIIALEDLRAEAWVENRRADLEAVARVIELLRTQNEEGRAARVVQVTGRTTGAVWGSGKYTSDSDIATAAVHAGLLKAGETGWIRVVPRPGRSAYQGSTYFGVTSSDYGPWAGSIRLERTDAPADAKSRRVVVVVGSRDGIVWGSGPYTDDSDVGTAAVHAGLLQPSEEGAIAVIQLPGRDSYDGSTKHGVTTRSYGRWSGSIRLEQADAGELPQ